MARGLPGADSFSQVTPNLIQAAQNIFGSLPQFWVFQEPDRRQRRGIPSQC
jgi:hypothetical protein